MRRRLRCWGQVSQGLTGLERGRTEAGNKISVRTYITTDTSKLPAATLMEKIGMEITSSQALITRHGHALLQLHRETITQQLDWS